MSKKERKQDPFRRFIKKVEIDIPPLCGVCIEKNQRPGLLTFEEIIYQCQLGFITPHERMEMLLDSEKRISKPNGTQMICICGITMCNRHATRTAVVNGVERRICTSEFHDMRLSELGRNKK